MYGNCQIMEDTLYSLARSLHCVNSTKPGSNETKVVTVHVMTFEWGSYLGYNSIITKNKSGVINSCTANLKRERCETANCFHDSSASGTSTYCTVFCLFPIYLYHPHLSSFSPGPMQTIPCSSPPTYRPNYLHVLAHHGNHEIEQTNGFDESETQNGVGEKLSTHAWVAGNSHQESGEDHTDTNTSTTETDGSGTHSEVLRDLNHSGSDF